MIKFNLFEKISQLFNLFENKESFNKKILDEDEFFIYIMSLKKPNKKQNKGIKIKKGLKSALVKIDNKDENIKKVEEKFYLVKIIYKKLAVRFHPDKKNGDHKLFLKINEYYNNDLLIGLILISYQNNMFNIELSKEDWNKIFDEINNLCYFMIDTY
tara:strand:+ start:223 stop:693 length:471 start_codon:yes stop_codon:yes gene_type:complete